MNNCVVKPYTDDSRTRVAPLVAADPFKPLARPDGWAAANLSDFAFQCVTKTLGCDASSSWLTMDGNRARGFACLSMLPWDSEQLGVTAARIDYLVAEGSYDQQRQVKKALLKQVLAGAQARGVEHLSVRVDASDASSLHLLEESGFITVDAILTFALDLNSHPSAELTNDFGIRLATAADAEPAAALARNSYLHDRFHCDPSITKSRADELHATWLRNSCTGKAADAVILAEDAAGLLGFVTCAVRRDTADRLGRTVGTIVLVAAAARARGRGVGYAMTMAALEWFRQQGCKIVEVGTQLRNLTASRLYQRCGFRLAGSSVSLRLLISPSRKTNCDLQAGRKGAGQ
jgi:dTDP-4-amino-4,6-dideoxy-D-galactose acyltransferase